MEYQIKRGLSTIATVRPDNGKQSQKIMGENILTMSFTLFQNVDFEVGDYIEAFGQVYTLNKKPTVKKQNTKQFEYSLSFEGLNYEAIKVAYLMLDGNNDLQESDFSLMGNASIFIDLVIRNLNRVQSGWSAGDIDNTPFKNLTFNNQNCLGVLSTLSTEYDIEFWIIGKVIHFTKKGANSGLSFEYGKNKGLYNIARNNKDGSDIVTRLYALGGTKNIPGNYRNYGNRLRIPISANAGKVYIEQNVSQFGIIEATEVFDDIYPQREGTVTSIVTTGDKPFLKFTDSTIDFDVNAQLLAGTVAKVFFNTGQLAGYEFELNSFNFTTKQFIINISEQEKALQVPSTLLKPAVGDKYVITDIIMPDSYITAAENLLLTKAQEFLTANSISRVVYAVECDRLKFKRDNITPTLGSYVNIKDTDLSIDANIRIIGLTRDIVNPFQYDLELSESAEPSGIIRSVIQQQKVANAIKINNLLNPARARRNWRDSQELLNLVFDTDGYFTDKIKPLSIETASLAVGARSQQFELNGFVAEPNFGGLVNHFKSSAAVLDHFTIDENQVVSWNISAADYDALTTGTAYYIYAKCDKTNNNGVILLTNTAITVNEDPAFYHFLLGVLHSTTDLATPRGLSLTYGQTTVNGKFIKTGKIQSSDGNTWFDLDQGIIKGKITFGDTGFSTVIDGNLVTTSSLILGNGTVNNAGVSGLGILGSDIRFWAGADYNNRNTAPFRVDQDGNLVATNATISGNINATSGTIAGVQISAGSNFSLNGLNVIILPDEGIKVFNNGYLDVTAGKIQIPHDLGTNRKVSFKFKTTAGTGGSPPPGGAQYLYNLLDVALSTPLNGQALLYNTALGKWVNQNVVTDLSNYWTKGEADGRYLQLTGGTITGDLSLSLGKLKIGNVSSLANNYDSKVLINGSININGTILQSGGDGSLSIEGDSSASILFYMDSMGNASFANAVTANAFVGDLIGNAATATKLTNAQGNWIGSNTIGNVVGLLAWKAYGNSHVIFDASAGTSPSGTAISQTNPDAVWSASFPTLMGWNGANTYGVRVDSARVSDSATNWGNSPANFDTFGTGTIGYLVGYDSGGTNIIKPWQAPAVRTFLGLGSAAYQNESKFIRNSTSFIGASNPFLADNFFDISAGQTTFAYASGADTPTTGQLLTINGNFGGGTYPLQLQGGYGDNNLWYRNRNGDINTWNVWQRLIKASELGSAAYLNASIGAEGLKLVQRDINGYINGNYINMTDNAIGSGQVTGIIAKAGDNYYRTSDAEGVRTFLGMPSGGDTLQSVTNRGNTTTQSINIGSQLNFYGASSEIVNRSGSALDLYSSGSTLAMRLLSNGNVGIGYSNDIGYKLAVNGGGYFAGNINVLGITIGVRAQTSDWWTMAFESQGSTGAAGYAFHIPGVYGAGLYMNTAGTLNWSGNGIDANVFRGIHQSNGQDAFYMNNAGNNDFRLTAGGVMRIINAANTVALFNINNDGVAAFSNSITAPKIKATTTLQIPHNLGTNRNVSLKFVS